MPLLERQLGDTNAVFNEIKNLYSPLRPWTVADLSYSAPLEVWLAQTRPQRSRSGAATPAQYVVETADRPDDKTNRIAVYISGINLATQLPVKTRVGSIFNRT